MHMARFKCRKNKHLKRNCMEQSTQITTIQNDENAVCFVTTAEQPYKLPCVFDEQFRVDTLLDTGSPVSFLSTLVLEQMRFEGKTYARSPTNISNFGGVNNQP